MTVIVVPFAPAEITRTVIVVLTLPSDELTASTVVVISFSPGPVAEITPPLPTVTVALPQGELPAAHTVWRGLYPGVPDPKNMSRVCTIV